MMSRSNVNRQLFEVVRLASYHPNNQVKHTRLTPRTLSHTFMHRIRHIIETQTNNILTPPPHPVPP
jgi:hypothetical protein